MKSESSDQALPLPPICVAALARHREAMADLGFGVAEDDLMFTTVTGRFVEARNFNRFWDRQTVAGRSPDHGS